MDACTCRGLQHNVAKAIWMVRYNLKILLIDVHWLQQTVRTCCMFPKRSDSAFDSERKVFDLFSLLMRKSIVSRSNQGQTSEHHRRGTFRQFAGDTWVLWRRWLRQDSCLKDFQGTSLRDAFPFLAIYGACCSLLVCIWGNAAFWCVFCASWDKTPAFLAETKRVKKDWCSHRAVAGLHCNTMVCVCVLLDLELVSCHRLDLRELLQATRLVQIKHRGPKGFGARRFRQKLMMSGYETKWLLEIWIIFGRAW